MSYERLDAPLLRKVMEHIEAHPEEHDQTRWAQQGICGTTMCFAGHVVTMAGHTIDWPRNPWMNAHEISTGEPISRVARRELGVTEDEAWALFFGATTRVELRVAVDAILDGRDPMFALSEFTEAQLIAEGAGDRVVMRTEVAES